nr:HIT domain protein [uncultured bacterium]AIA14240.1 HIT domain protein [uncultured bacterium]
MTEQPGAFVDLEYARSDNYRQVLEEIIASGVCPFCPENFRWHPNPILGNSGDWFATESMQPYEDTDKHVLIIGRTHKEELAELTGEDLSAVHALARGVLKWAGAGGGGLMLRFGDTRFTGATVKHLHFHVIVPEIDPDTDRAKPVWFPIG